MSSGPYDYDWKLRLPASARARLAEIRCPMLVVVGEHDPSMHPQLAVELTEAIADASMVVIPNASHVVSVGTPTAVNEAMQLLEGSGPVFAQ